ncbi:MAG: NAD(P)H-quinone oxidoreductase [Phototrophicales bacterium]
MSELPATYRKVVVTRPSRDFRAATDIVEVPMPQPGPGQLLIKTFYAGVNASDLNISAGFYFADEPPFDTGVEATGEVVAVGADVNGFKVGDHVLSVMLGGGYREYNIVDAAMAIPIPQATPEITATAVGALTALMALDIAGEMRSNEIVLITAAAGGVGNFAVQIAKQAGNHVIGTCSTPEKAEELRRLGCDRVIVYTQEDMNTVLQTEYPQGVNLVLEGVGTDQFDSSVANLAKLGRVVIIGFISEYKGEPQVVTAPRIYHQLLWKSATLRGFLYSDYPERIPEYLGQVMQLVLEGKLTALVDDTPFYGVEQVADAVEHLHSGKNKGKVLVRF